MDTSMKPLSLAISEHSSVKGTPKAIRDWLMSCLPASPASPSVSPESKPENQTPETSGPKRLSASASYDPDSHSWRTYQASLLTNILEPFSETWPRAGMIAAGRLFRRLRWERRINEIGSGFWPTVQASEVRQGLQIRRSGKKGSQISLTTVVKMFPTVSVHGNYNRKGASLTSGDGLATALGGPLNPTWTDWYMGWPMGATGLKPLETAWCLNVWPRPGIS